MKLQRTLSTSRVYRAADEFCPLLPDDAWPVGRTVAIGRHLTAELFSYRRDINGDIEGHNHMENHLINPMPWIVTSAAPLLLAPQVNTLAGFDRTFRTTAKSQQYKNKQLLFISSLNIDISPQEGQLFPLTKYVHWAAYIQDGKGGSRTLEQPEIIEMLVQQSTENPDQIDLETAIQQMIDAHEVRITL